MMKRTGDENIGNMKQGQDLVTVGYAGLAGSLCLLKERYKELSRWFSQDYLEGVLRWKTAPEPAKTPDWAAFGAAAWEESGLGGIFKTIWTLSGYYGVGVEVHLRDIPIRQETIEICERLGCNPYRLYSRGCWLLAADHGGRLIEQLEKIQLSARVIGRVKPGTAREVIRKDGRGFLERPRGDEIFKIIPHFVEKNKNM